jgi:hypothetical protein
MNLIKYKNLKEIGFTMYNFNSLIFCYIYNFEVYNLYSIICCWSWGIVISFHSILYFDKYAFIKMAKKLKINIIAFHCGNLLLHLLPCYINYIIIPKNINLYHGIVSVIIHASWIYIISNKTWNLSNIYIKEPQTVWNKLYLICFTIEIITPFLYNSNYYINKSILFTSR